MWSRTSRVRVPSGTPKKLRRSLFRLNFVYQHLTAYPNTSIHAPRIVARHHAHTTGYYSDTAPPLKRRAADTKTQTLAPTAKPSSTPLQTINQKIRTSATQQTHIYLEAHAADQAAQPHQLHTLPLAVRSKSDSPSDTASEKYSSLNRVSKTFHMLIRGRKIERTIDKRNLHHVKIRIGAIVTTHNVYTIEKKKLFAL